MESSSMVLRASVFEPLITKGSELTFENLDGNFIKIFQDLNTLFGGALNAPFVDVVQGSVVSGTTEEAILNVVDISGNERVYNLFKALQEGLIQFSCRVKLDTTNTMIRIYLSQDITLSGSSVLLATSPIAGSGNKVVDMSREFISAGNLFLVDPTRSLYDDKNPPEGTELESISGWEFENMYLIFTCDNGSTEDTAQYISCSIIPIA